MAAILCFLPSGCWVSTGWPTFGALTKPISWNKDHPNSLKHWTISIIPKKAAFRLAELPAAELPALTKVKSVPWFFANFCFLPRKWPLWCWKYKNITFLHCARSSFKCFLVVLYFLSLSNVDIFCYFLANFIQFGDLLLNFGIFCELCIFFCKFEHLCKSCDFFSGFECFLSFAIFSRFCAFLL